MREGKPVLTRCPSGTKQRSPLGICLFPWTIQFWVACNACLWGWSMHCYPVLGGGCFTCTV